MVAASEIDIASVVNARGNRIYFDPRDPSTVSLHLVDGEQNPGSFALWSLAADLHDWDLMVHVGPNYGEMIVGTSVPSGTRIVALEPSQHLLPYLAKTLSEYDHPVELLDVAVSDRVATTTVDRVFRDSPQRSACIRIDAGGNEPAVLAGATELLATLDQWAVMIDILHIPLTELGQLVSAHHFYLLDVRSNGLVRVLSKNPDVLGEMLTSGWLHSRAALLTSAPMTIWLR